MKQTYKFTITYESVVDTDTGEILETKIVDRTELKAAKAAKAPSKPKEVEDPDPKLILEDNKFRLNSAAVALMQLTADDKIDIKYEADGTPTIGTDSAFGTKGGNKLTKSNTVACRGSKNQELARYGTEFGVAKHPTKDGLFVLTSDKIEEAKKAGDDNVSLEEEDEVPFDLNLDGLVDDKDADATEIDSSFFKL